MPSTVCRDLSRRYLGGRSEGACMKSSTSSNRWARQSTAGRSATSAGMAPWIKPSRSAPGNFEATLQLPSGGGIVADSSPNAEYAELMARAPCCGVRSSCGGRSLVGQDTGMRRRYCSSITTTLSPTTWCRHSWYWEPWSKYIETMRYHRRGARARAFPPVTRRDRARPDAGSPCR